MAKLKLTADQRRTIVETMQLHLHRSKEKPELWVYEDGWSDQKIATDNELNVSNVIGVRTSMFGKLDSVGYVPIGALVKRVAAMEGVIADLKRELHNLRIMQHQLPEVTRTYASNGAAPTAHPTA